MKERIEAELFRIADEISSKACLTQNGIFIKTMQPQQARNFTWDNTDNLYSGNAGLLLFFIALYQYSSEQKYAQTAKNISQYLMQAETESSSPFSSLFLGKAGVAFALIRMYKVFNQTTYLDQAEHILKTSIRPSPEYSHSDYSNMEFFNGAAGILVALLHLYDVKKEEWILKEIDHILQLLLTHIQHGLTGVYWNRSFDSIHGLCGLSHGASGVAFALLEVGRYFRNESFFWLVQQAFCYEAAWYNEYEKNWCDLRTSISDKGIFASYEVALKNKNIPYFVKYGFFNGWCNGAVGIGMVRLRAFELLNNTSYLKEALLAIDKTIETDISNENSINTYTLCHGTCGNAELFLEAHRVLGEEKYRKLAFDACKKAIAHYKKNGYYIAGYAGYQAEDTSLFMGTAGIGYFYLRVLAPERIDSVLLPCLSSYASLNSSYGNYTYLSISLPDLKKKVLGRIYERTIAIAEHLFPDKNQHFFATKNASLPLKKQFSAYIKRQLNQLEGRKKEVLADILKLESTKIRLDEQSISDVLSYVKNKLAINDISSSLTMDNECLFNTKFILHPDITLFITRWNWEPRSDYMENLSVADSHYFRLLYPTSYGIVEAGLDQVSYLIAGIFKRGKTVKKGFKEFLSYLEITETVNSSDMIADLERGFLTQIKEAIQATLLIKDELYTVLQTKSSIKSLTTSTKIQ